MLCNMVSSCFDISDVRTYKEYMLCFVFFIPFAGQHDYGKINILDQGMLVTSVQIFIYTC